MKSRENKKEIHRALKAYKKENKIKSVLIALKVILCLGCTQTKAELTAWPARGQGWASSSENLALFHSSPGCCACPAALPTALRAGAWSGTGHSVLPQQPLADRALHLLGHCHLSQMAALASCKGAGGICASWLSSLWRTAMRLSLDML